MNNADRHWVKCTILRTSGRVKLQAGVQLLQTVRRQTMCSVDGRITRHVMTMECMAIDRFPAELDRQ